MIVATWDHHAGTVFALVRERGIDAQLVFDRAALMLLPTGVNKAQGVRRALEELGRSEHNTIAFGDAENDHPLLAMATIGVAARGLVASVLVAADDHRSYPGPFGVVRYVQSLGAGRWTAPTPARHRIMLRHAADGAAAAIACSGGNVMVSGDPRSGKSWIAGLTVEQFRAGRSSRRIPGSRATCTMPGSTRP